MFSINTNASALTALQALQQTQQALSQTQQQVSTGYSVNSAADNASYFSIATQLKADSGIVNASNSALSETQAILKTASSAISSVLTTINSIQTALTEATNPGANITQINAQLSELGQQLKDAVTGASFNGLNLLDGSQDAAPLNFVAGFTASNNSGSFNTISLQTQALSNANGGATVTNSLPNITDTATIGELNALTDNTGSATLSPSTEVVDKTTDTTGDSFTIQSQALDGTTSTTKYTGLDANGNITTASSAASFAVQVTTTASAGMVTQGSIDLTNFQIGSGGVTAGSALTAVELAQAAVTNYAATIGSTQDRATSASNLNSALTTNYAAGVSALIDADMNVASTRLQALQTQQQLGIQSLSIANQNSQLILKLFQ
jgi:flagellin